MATVQAKIVHVSIDGLPISPPEGFLIRKGPGYVFFDFAQEINFVESRNLVTKSAAAAPPPANSNNSRCAVAAVCKPKVLKK